MNERAAKRARIFPSRPVPPAPAPQLGEARASVDHPEGHEGPAADGPAGLAGDVADGPAGLAGLADGPAGLAGLDAGVIVLDDPGAPHIVACMCCLCSARTRPKRERPLEAEA